MTLNGAIKQLHELRSAEDMPIYYKPIIAEVINVLLMDTQEVKHGHWIKEGYSMWCSECSGAWDNIWDFDYCPNCGTDMRGE